MKVSPVKFKTFVVAQEIKPTPPLGPLLGQYGLNIIQFCDDLNRQTFIYQKGCVLPITVTKSPIFPKGYDVVIKPPTISFLFSNVFFEKDDKFSGSTSDLEPVLLFDLARVYSEFHSVPLIRASKIIFSFLNSIHGKAIVKL